MFSVLSCAKVKQEKALGLSILNFKGFKCEVTSFGENRRGTE